MFDISWTEFLLIGVVALIVIGPKELPGVMRTMGQWTRKIRGMANDFQNQFQEAMREAEMGDLKKQVDDMAQDFKQYDPLKSVRDDVENIGKGIEKSFSGTPEPTPMDLKPDLATADAAALPPETAAAAAIAAPEPPATLPASEPAATLPAPEPAPAEPAAVAAAPESTERT